MIQNLQSLRFFFIMLVVMSHIIGKSFDFGGECGVSFFFVLSGFVLSYAYGQKIREEQFQLKPFLKRQLLKFYPLHLLTFLIMLALDARLGQYYDFPKLVANALLLQSWVPSDDFYFVANAPSWFLSDLLFFYIVFPWLFLWLINIRELKLWLTMAVVVALYTCLAVAIPQEMVNPVLYISPLTRILDFALGILLFRYCSSASGQQFTTWLKRQSEAVVSCLEVLMFLWVVVSFFIYEHSPASFRCASLFWCVSPVFLLVYIKSDKLEGLVTSFLHHPFVLWLGSISLEIYLTHFVTMRILYGMMNTIGIPDEERLNLIVVAITIVLIIVVSFIVKRFYVDKIYGALIKYV